jgi:hypothetical protein
MTPRPPLRRIVVLDDLGAAAREAADWSGLPVEILHEHLVEDALVRRLQDQRVGVLKPAHKRIRTPTRWS